MSKIHDLKPLVPMEKRDYPFTSERRYELKMSSAWGSPALGRSWIRIHPEGFREAYAPRMVNNLYLDTIDLQSFNDNLAGVSERVKLRLRWYGNPENHEIINPSLELKIKKNMMGDKSREVLNITLDLQKSYTQILKQIRSSAGERWLTFLQSAVQPTIINRYRREYFVSPDGAIRVTLDYALETYNQRLGLRPNLDRPQPASEVLLLEVKSMPQYRERLERAMGFFPIQRTRNSKYVNGLLGGPI